MDFSLEFASINLFAIGQYGVIQRYFEEVRQKQNPYSGGVGHDVAKKNFLFKNKKGF